MKARIAFFHFLSFLISLLSSFFITTTRIFFSFLLYPTKVYNSNAKSIKWIGTFLPLFFIGSVDWSVGSWSSQRTQNFYFSSKEYIDGVMIPRLSQWRTCYSHSAYFCAILSNVERKVRIFECFSRNCFKK